MDTLDGDDVVSAGQWIMRETLLEMQAALQSSRPCTYSSTPTGLKALGVTGIMQPIFACKTCAAAKGAPVGVCEPCVLRCHADHDVIELHEKRQFTCDCPTDRSSVACTAQPQHQASASADDNESALALLPADGNNRYGHNFYGRFCTCDKNYDPACDTMYQCLRCDEWYHNYDIARHSSCLPQSIPFNGFVCWRCVAEAPYLTRFGRYVSGVCANAVTKAHGTGVLPAAASSSLPSSGASPATAAAAASPPAATPHSSSASSSSSSSSSSGATPAGSPSIPSPAAPASASSGGGGGAPQPTCLQPWAVCLTCTDGADDGRGVCMACAAACHKGHVLSKPRITEFYCDCGELLAEAAKREGADAANAKCCIADAPVPSAAVSSEGSSGETQAPCVYQAWCAASGGEASLASSSANSSSSGACSMPSATPSKAAASSASCASQPVIPASALSSVAAGSIFITDDDELLARLCRCASCMQRYASDGCATWFFDSPVDAAGISGGDVVDAEAAAAVPQMLERLASQAQRQVATTTAGNSNGSSSASSSSSSSSSSAAAASSSSSAPAAGAAAEDDDAVASKVGRVFSALAASGFKTSFERGMSALSALPVTQQLDAMAAYSQLREGFLAFLKGFADSGRVVTKGDVDSYFASLRQGNDGGDEEGRRVRPRTD